MAPFFAGASAGDATVPPQRPQRQALPGVLLFLGVLLRPEPAFSQHTDFHNLPFRDPRQCERMQCLSVSSSTCREHDPGFYLKEKGCTGGQICTNCIYGNTTECQCENPPYAVEATYGQECNLGKVCAPGAGLCFRPCHTYLHSTLCPTTIEEHCYWDKQHGECVPKKAEITLMRWVDTAIGTIQAQADELVQSMPGEAYPLDFDTLRASTVGYRIQGVLLENITEPESLFLKLDSNRDGHLSAHEYSALPAILAQLDNVVSAQQQHQQEEEQAQEAATQANQRRLQSVVTPEICNAQQQFYCSFDVACKSDCNSCGWKTATDRAFATCVIPSPPTCYADGGKVYCESDQLCHAPADCNKCFDRPIVDHSQHKCMALWWDPDPSPQWANWVCRHRNKVGMPCQHDQDCIYGMRRCLGGECQPLQPYNPNQTCSTDLDCPHLNYYCPSDPTGGENQYWINYCRRQREEGITCLEDRECLPDLRCNLAEPQPRCRRYFSLDLGTPAAYDTLCKYGWRDIDSNCASPAKSKEAGRGCDTDLDCTTTDRTGRKGSCVCKAWWEEDDSKYCLPVAGDYERHQEKLRNYIWFRVSNCGFHWTEEECLQVFGDKARRLKLEVECETQELSNGPYLPPEICNIHDEERFFDACAALSSLGGARPGGNNRTRRL